MKQLKKIALAATGIGLLPLLALAQEGGESGVGSGLSITSIGEGIANAAWIVFTIIAVICFIVSAILFLTSFGDAEKVKRARDTFLWGIVGIVVGLVAFGAVRFVQGIIGG